MKRETWSLAAGILLIAAEGLLAGQDQTTHVQVHNTVSPTEVAAGWKLLFDGKTLTGWRNYQRQTIGAGWQVVDGALTRAARGGGDIVYGAEKFRNFELVLDWRLDTAGAAGNSGVFFRATEDREGPIYNFAPEIQILDDARHQDGRREVTSAGSNYDMHPVPRGVTRPIGQWNTLRVVVNGKNVQHWLNGQKVVDYDIGSPDWLQRKAASKWAQMEFYGLAPEGYIGLQDHGSFVAFRNVKIRPLP
jgi:hypothetical protein